MTTSFLVLTIALRLAVVAALVWSVWILVQRYRNGQGTGRLRKTYETVGVFGLLLWLFGG